MFTICATILILADKMRAQGLAVTIIFDTIVAIVFAAAWVS